MACYAEDIEIFTFPQEPLLKGKAALRERYGDLFRSFPGEQATILHRAVYGNFVADHEQMRLRPIAPTVIYQEPVQVFESSATSPGWMPSKDAAEGRCGGIVRGRRRRGAPAKARPFGR